MSACSYQIGGLILDLLEPRHLSCAGATAAAAAGGRDDDDDECAGGTVMRRGGNATRGRLLYSGRPPAASACLRIDRLASSATTRTCPCLCYGLSTAVIPWTSITSVVHETQTLVFYKN